MSQKVLMLLRLAAAMDNTYKKYTISKSKEFHLSDILHSLREMILNQDEVGLKRSLQKLI